MKKFYSLILVLITAFSLSACCKQENANLSEGKKDGVLSLEDSQSIFDEAFLLTQAPSDGEMKKKEISIDLGLSVSDNENNVLPKELEVMRGDIDLNYNFLDEENASGSLSVSLSFNESSAPDLGFSASMQGRDIKYTLNNFTLSAANFLGLTELIGGEVGVENLKKAFLGKENIYNLTDQQYRDIVKSTKEINKEGDIVVNTEEQEKAIAQAFVKNQVVKILEGKKEGSVYILGFQISPDSLIGFLNEVAEINNLERDFSSDRQWLSKLDISGDTEIDDKKDLLSMDGEIFVDKTLIESSDKDAIIGFNFKNENEVYTWKFSLIDSIKNETQAEFDIKWKTN